MFTIKRVTDARQNSRICGSFGIEDAHAFSYAAFSEGQVLGTAVFLTAPGGCVTFCAVDTGRRMDVDLADGLARAAFSAQLRAGAGTACLGAGLPKELRLALSKRGYLQDGPFALAPFFEKKNCKK